MGNDNGRYPKSSFLMCLTTLEKVGESEGKPNYRVISSNWKKCRGRDFKNSLLEERQNGINHEIQIVNKKPEQFVVNQIYMLATRDKIWIWVEEDKSKEN